METQAPSEFRILLTDALTALRGPWFLSAMSVLLIGVAIPAHATLLRGYVQNAGSTSAHVAKASGIRGPSEEAAKPSSIALDAVGAEASGTPYISPEEATADKVAEGAENGKLHRSMIMPDSFPTTFTGVWKVVTVVVDSAVSTVPVGSRVESSVNFEKSNNGKVVAHWVQPGWTEAQASVTPMSSNEVALERTNYFKNGGSWAAHSRDRYLQIDPNRIAADSQIEQFLNGQFVGKYETKSMLYKMNGALAMVETKE